MIDHAAQNRWCPRSCRETVHRRDLISKNTYLQPVWCDVRASGFRASQIRLRQELRQFVVHIQVLQLATPIAAPCA